MGICPVKIFFFAAVGGLLRDGVWNIDYRSTEMGKSTFSFPPSSAALFHNVISCSYTSINQRPYGEEEEEKGSVFE